MRLSDWPPEIIDDLWQRAREAGTRRTPLDEIARWLDLKPPWAKWATRCESLTLAASAVKTEITAYVIPPAHYGVLRFFANLVGSVSDYPNVTFSLDVDGAPLEGFGSIIGPISPGLNSPIPLMEPLMPHQRVRVVATNTTASAISNVLAFFRLYHWPISASSRPLQDVQ